MSATLQVALRRRLLQLRVVIRGTMRKICALGFVSRFIVAGLSCDASDVVNALWNSSVLLLLEP
jgi:hypothetical protein